MPRTWESLYLSGCDTRRAARLMNCSTKTAAARLGAASGRIAAERAYLDRETKKKTSLENSAYDGLVEWGSLARVPLSDRLPQLVGMNDRASQIRPSPDAVCHIPLAKKI